MIESIGVISVIASIPLIFGAVEPSVWTVYAGMMICLFLVAWRQKKVDWGFAFNPLWIGSVGVFLAFTLVQVLPLPEAMMAVASPFRHTVLTQAADLLRGVPADGLGVLVGNPMAATGRETLSYQWRPALAWWGFLLGAVLFARVFQVYAYRTKNLMLVVSVMLGVAIFEAFYGLMQALIPTLGVLWADTEAYLGDARGTFINRNHFAGFVEMVWPLGLGLILALAHIWRRGAHGVAARGAKRLKHFLASDHIGIQLSVWAALLFILLALLFSKSRAGITGAFIGFSVFVLLVYFGGKRFTWPVWTAMGLGFVFLMVYGNAIGFEEIIGRFMAIDEHGSSRVHIWIGTMAISRDHPLGIGLGNYETVMQLYNAHGAYGIKYAHAHNDYLQLLAEAGWPGFIALVAGFYAFLAKSIWRLYQYGAEMDPVKFYIGIGACSGLISIAFHSFFDFNLQIPANLLYFALLMAIVRVCFRDDRSA
jgi:O-antigen ligase